MDLNVYQFVEDKIKSNINTQEFRLAVNVRAVGFNYCWPCREIEDLIGNHVYTLTKANYTCCKGDWGGVQQLLYA